MECVDENGINGSERNKLLANGRTNGSGTLPDWTVKVEPWPEPVDGKLLLEDLAKVYRGWAVLPTLRRW